MEQFGIQINDGSNIIPNFIVKQNEASVTLFDWQRRAIDYFFSHNNTAIFEVATGCLTKDTLIELPRNLDNYPNGIPIKELVGKENFYVYSFNIEKQQLELKKAKKVWMAGKNKDVYEITLFSGKKIRTTKNHPFLVDIKKKPEKGCGQGKREKIISRIYKNLEDLKIGDYLTTFNRATIRCTDGEQIKVNYNEKRILEHRFIAQQVFDKLKKHDIVHHIDENKSNNDINNLMLFPTNSAHARFHAKQRKLT